MNPVRIVPLLLIAVVLMGALPACDRATIERYSDLITGTSPAPQAAALYIAPSVEAVVEPSSSSSEEVVTVAAVVEPEVVPEPEPEVIVPPEPEPCLPVQWRGNWYSCDMKVLIGPVE
jgi:hypothetical protein